jgi:hypothetical protein
MGRCPTRLSLDYPDGESGMGSRLAAYPGGSDEGWQGFRVGRRGGESQLDEKRWKWELRTVQIGRVRLGGEVCTWFFKPMIVRAFGTRDVWQ